jgi:hypothetical protein
MLPPMHLMCRRNCALVVMVQQLCVGQCRKEVEIKGSNRGGFL